MPWEFIGGLLLIFVARCTDVTMNVFRTLMIVRGRRFIAATIGFFEVMVFLLVMGFLLGGGKTLTIPELVAYCAGFSCGNLLGIFLEGKLLDSIVLIEIIADKNSDSEKMISRLRDAGFGTTVLIGEGRSGQRIVAKVLCSRNHIARVREIAGGYGFLFVSDVKGVMGGHFTRTVGK